ncbi:protein Lines homolog 1 [Fundulus heteroclitus]|uniref:protein Lines homolog 1 n=1 Tax=Fundulus heteroclitus TaxID=8078 RepID=UPI00165BCA96|nr:protein Lines homolog 1 [Fundulus heteroclitus]
MKFSDGCLADACASHRGSMELAESSAPSSCRELLCCLEDCHRCLLRGSPPALSAAQVAELLFSGVCGQVPGGQAEQSADAVWELTGFSVSLLGKICCWVSAQSLHGDSWAAILRLLLEHMDVMAQLVHHFRAEDQLISHLAAKTASECVFYLLSTSGTVSPAWQWTCVQAFSSSPPAPELDACLWSLTEVLKKLLRQSHPVLLGELVATFDCSLIALCCKLLPADGTEVSFSGRWGTTVCLLLDLLEVLTMAAVTRGGGVPLRSQRIPGLHSAALLTIVSSRSEYFVKKRILLLLKRFLLQKLGDDWSLEGVLSTARERRGPSADGRALAQSVLKAVADNWLQSVQVEHAVFFGGARRRQQNEGLKPDGTLLRAVSLVLLKSVELHFQTAAAGVDSRMEVNSYLGSLWTFLRRCNASQVEVTHPCSWISLLFGEQDDDLMEAASAFLSIFLSYRQCSGLEDFSILEEACASGCNPHCHFVLLLQSLSFDHSILLDFLISSETCFLEYFVRYLKYLQADWLGFTAACGHRTVPLADSHGSEPGEGLRPGGSAPTLEESSLGVGLRIVEYDSSDESGEETPDPNKQSESPTAVMGDVSSELKTKPSTSVVQSDQECPTAAALLEQGACDTLCRVVSCLSELRAVVTRLQTKKLFPYNPSSLLKLLAHIENYHQRSPPALSQK